MPEGVIERREVEVRKNFCWILILTACLLGMMSLTALAADSEDIVENGDTTMPQSADVTADSPDPVDGADADDVSESAAPSGNNAPNSGTSRVERVLYGGSTPMGGGGNIGVIVFIVAVALWVIQRVKK